MRRSDALLVAMAVVFAAAPWLYGVFHKPAGAQYFPTFVMASGDAAVYYRYINEGRTSGVFMRDAYTTEPNAAILWQPLWWVLGRAARAFDASAQAVFFVARLLSAGILALTCAWAARRIFSDEATRKVAAWLAYFGAGVGGLVSIFWPSIRTAFSLRPYDTWVSEGYAWMSSLASPHFLLVTAGLIFVVVGLEFAWNSKWVRRAVGPVLLLVLSVHPFHLLTLGLWWAGMTAVDLVRKPREAKEGAARRLGVALWALPAIVYYIVTAFDPMVAGRADQNINLTYPLPMVLGILPVAIFAGITLTSTKRSITIPLAVWAIAILLATVVPFPFQRRLFQGTMIPLAFVAAPAIVSWLRERKRTVTVIVVLACMIVSPAYVLGASFSMIRKNQEIKPANLTYLSAEFVGLIETLQSHPGYSPVLTSKINGNILGAFDSIKVYSGHAVETLRYSEKTREVEQFYAKMTPAERLRFAREKTICVVLITPYERTYGAVENSILPGAKILYANGTVTLLSTGVCPGV